MLLSTHFVVTIALREIFLGRRSSEYQGIGGERGEQRNPW
jgi:hypothetical protein